VADLNDVAPRYRRAARLWALRALAEDKGISAAELILETMRARDGAALEPRADFAAALRAHVSARAARMGR
jgi:hypothetical protein